MLVGRGQGLGQLLMENRLWFNASVVFRRRSRLFQSFSGVTQTVTVVPIRRRRTEAEWNKDGNLPLMGRKRRGSFSPC